MVRTDQSAPVDARTGLRAYALFACILILLVTAASLTTLERIKAAYLSTPSATPGLLVTALTIRDAVLITAVLALGIALALAEYRHQALRRLSAGEAPRLQVLISACLALWFSHALLAPGLLVVGDAGAHVARVAHLMEALRDGASLYWDNGFYGGGTLLQFSGPVFHWIATSLGMVLGDATTAVKVAVVASRLAGAGLMYVFLRSLGLGQSVALFGAVAYGGAFVQTYLLSIRSGFPQAINLAVLPAILLCLEKILADRRIISPAWCGMCIAAILMVGNHQPTAFIAALFVGAWLCFRLSSLGWTVRRTTSLGLAGVTVAVASAYFVVPFIVEKPWTAENFSTQLVGLRWPNFAALLTWAGMGTGSNADSYLGWSVLSCAASGAIVCLRSKFSTATARVWLVSMALVLASLFVDGSYVRMVVFTLFFLVIAATAAMQAWTEARPRWTALPALLFTALLVDLGPTAIQPWTRSDMRVIEEAGYELSRRLNGQRALEVRLGLTGPLVSLGPDATPLVYARVNVLNGPHNGSLLKQV